MTKTTLFKKTHEKKEEQPPYPPAPENDNMLTEGSDKNDPIYNIHGRKGWAIYLVLPSKLKKFLDSFVDFENKTIRSDSIALGAYLRKETGLTMKRIRDYYQGLFGASEQKKTEEKRKAREGKTIENTFRLYYQRVDVGVF
ncbi:hypothetical protein BD770DRAFT_438809 [Pilaira anomala]|nr:hypothetical protein BD770DRAFT_438809 [Pilaira anomala]